MKHLLALAALSSCMVPSRTLPGPRSFVCIGNGTAEGYPYGKQDTGQVQYLVTFTDGQITVYHPKDKTSFCPLGSTCTPFMSSEEVGLNLQSRPNADPLYTARFRLKLGDKTFTASGGGLDGGWSEKGKCRAAAALG